MSRNSFNTRTSLTVGDRSYVYFSLPAAKAAGLGDVDRLPMSLKILLENLLRFDDGVSVKEEDVRALAGWAQMQKEAQEEGRDDGTLWRKRSPSARRGC